MCFGKKGSGKTTFFVKMMLKYQKKGYDIYTNIEDIMIPGVKIINPSKLGKFVPVENSVLFLDEAGSLYNNRNFKSFSQDELEFYQLQRHYKVVVFLASQAYDVDKKLRNLTDEMYLFNRVLFDWSLGRRIKKSIKLVESTAEAESRIAENLKFALPWEWTITYLPPYRKYFDSFLAPPRPKIPYKYNVPPAVDPDPDPDPEEVPVAAAPAGDDWTRQLASLAKETHL